MAKRKTQTLMDYMVIGISPVLIMALVGSLLLFLLTVFYHGQYDGRLMFIFSMFVMAIVLIARISMEEGIEYATLFAIPLGLVTAIAMMRFVRISGALADFSILINLGLMALVWWSAHKLTWDCTLIDDAQDSSGEGLLQGMGFARDADQDADTGRASDAEGGSLLADTSGPATKRQDGWPLWWQRMIDRRHRPHTPGVWVVYYSIAALILFALGQLFIPASDPGARLSAFRFLFIYVASALGLLLTTSFLGLRRYLRQRNLQMPGDMASMWLGVGAIMILALLLFCVLLPRPGAAVKVSQLPFRFGSPEHRRTQREAVGKDGSQQREKGTGARQGRPELGRSGGEKQQADSGRSGEEQSDSTPQHKPPDSHQSPNSPPQQSSPQSRPSGPQQQSQGQDNQGSPQSGNSQSQPNAQRAPSESQTSPSQTQTQTQTRMQGAETPSGKQQGNSPESTSEPSTPSRRGQSENRPRQSDSQSRPPRGDGDQPAQSPPSRDTNANDTNAREPDGSDPAQREGYEERDTEGQNDPASSDRERGGRGGGAESGRASKASAANDSAEGERASSRGNSRSFSPTRVLTGLGSRLGTLLKLLLWAVLLVLLGYFAWKHRDRVRQAIAQLLDDLQNLWARLFGGRRSGGEDPTAPGPLALTSQQRMFASYADPFAAGKVDQYSAEQLIRHSFEAMEAWARERACPRMLEQTPLEFAQHVAAEHPGLGMEAQTLADLYCRVAYGHEPIRDDRRGVLQRLWRYMRSTAAMPAPPLGRP